MNQPFHQVALLLHEGDGVAVLKRALAAGAELDGVPPGHGRNARLLVASAIPAGHKIALRAHRNGEEVRKYGQIIGFATQDIPAGAHVHLYNLQMHMGDVQREYVFGQNAHALPPLGAGEARTFPGYLRPDGRVGTRNYAAIISSVNCSASVSHFVRDRFRTADFQRDFPNVDGVLAFTHKSGCNVQPGEPAAMLQRTLVGMARHPNVCGYVMIGLGCETNQVSQMVENYQLDQLRPGQLPPAFLTIQQTGGVAKTVAAGVAAMEKLLPLANAARRTPQPVGKLALALNCGGSDGNSGITANPALGVASDTLVRHGGISVLAETPEIYGAEHLLAGRALNAEIGRQLIERIRWWEEYVRQQGASIDNNPSFGNKAGGLTTIYEKSLGAVAKGGQAPLAAVYRYAETVSTPGLGFMDTPGLDPVSMTGLVAGGCTLGAFTTGRGSVYGCKPAPCLKIATNTALYERMMDDMDLNAGTILDGTETVEQVGRRIFEALLAVAGGKKTKSEVLGLGDEEFAPWILGPTF